MSDLPHSGATPHPRGFAYFCEEALRYTGGVRAWLFFGPYLLGAIWLEPARGGSSIHGFWSWLALVAYLLIFPPVWRAILLATGLWRMAAANQVSKTGPYSRSLSRSA